MRTYLPRIDFCPTTLNPRWQNGEPLLSVIYPSKLRNFRYIQDSKNFRRVDRFLSRCNVRSRPPFVLFHDL